MTRRRTSISWDDLKRDAGYLAEELLAFKGLVEWIPFAERPLGQESIADMLVSVQKIQQETIIPLLSEWQQTLSGGTPIYGSQALRELVFSEDSDHRNKAESVFPSAEGSVQEGAESVLELLDHLIAARREIMDMLHLDNGDIDEKRIILHGHAISLSEVVQSMIRFERSELRKIGKQIQAMETDRRG